MSGTVLGLSAVGFDTAAVVLRDGAIVAAAQEERFTRRKAESGFPARAARWCLDDAVIGAGDLDAVAFADAPADAAGRSAMRRAMTEALPELSGVETVFVPRPRATAAAAFLAGPHPSAAVLVLDRVAGAGASLWRGDGTTLDLLATLDAAESPMLLYSAATHHCGFRPNGGEYKLMGLAPYGEPTLVPLIRERLLEREGTRVDARFFDPDFERGHGPPTTARFEALFGPPRPPESVIEARHMDLARSVQAVTEELVLALARRARAATGADALCLAGALALNCVANARLLRDGPFADVWVQPAAGDAGGALGAALVVAGAHLGRRGDARSGRNGMRGCLLGPAFDDEAAAAMLAALGATVRRLDEAALVEEVARRLAAGRVVGWMQGRMEFGPRALGNRSILADARRPDMQRRLNQAIKFRESFRPFAPSVTAERAADWFEVDRPMPYMLFTARVAAARRLPSGPEEAGLRGLDRLRVARSTIPAVTHVDGSARLQTVDVAGNPRFHALLAAFERRTGCPVLIDTSFNVRDEPIVCTPEDAWRCFTATGMDDLCIGTLLLAKEEQPRRPDVSPSGAARRGAG